MVGTRGQLIAGWLVDVQNPARKRTVELFVGGKTVGFARADRRHEVTKHGGDGFFGFAFYYRGQPADSPAEVSAVESETNTPLRWKNPPIVASSPGPEAPLEVEGIRITNGVELLGRVNQYPSKDIALEFWRGSERVKAEIPLSVPKTGGSFAAQVPADLLPVIFSEDGEAALPGLKEAGLAVSLRNIAVATVAHKGDLISISLGGKVILGDQGLILVRFLLPNSGSFDVPAVINSTDFQVTAPSGFEWGDNTVEVYVGDARLPVRYHQELIEDARFQTIGQEAGPWLVSEGAVGEDSFFAFPDSLLDSLKLSGHIAHITRVSDDAVLKLSQVVREEPAKRQPFIIAARSDADSTVTVRLSDQSGTLCEESTSPQCGSSWYVLKLKLEEHRQVSGQLVFEVESRGANVAQLDIAVGGSRTLADPTPVEPVNIVANPGLQIWPDGIGIRQHISEGAVAEGWRLTNPNVSTSVLTRAITHSVDSAVGLAIAAPEVKRLRLEADLISVPSGPDPLLIRFRAGAVAAARQLVANQMGPNSEFMQIERVAIIRRTGRDQVITVVAKKITLTNEVQRFAFPAAIKAPGKGDVSADVEQQKETFHLLFEFSQPVAFGLFDVEVVQQTSFAKDANEPKLKLEDRNIELQIPTIAGLNEWIVPKRASVRRPSYRKHLPAKWSVEASREPVTIVIPVFNALRETLACVDSIAGSTRVPLLLKLIDDGSDEPVCSALEEYAADKPWVQLISLGDNRGYTYAADFGVRSAETEWAVLLNSDTIVTHGWLEGLLACARSDPQIAFAGPLSNAASFQSVPELYSGSGKWKINNLPAGMTPNDLADIVRSVSMKSYPTVPLLNGFCTLMRRSAFVELGGLNPAAFPSGYGEENDLCLRAGKAGFKLAVADDVYVYHVKSASFGGAQRDQLSEQGNLALRQLHPDVDIKALTKSFRDCLPLVAVREGIAKELAHIAEMGSSISTTADDAAAQPNGAGHMQEREVQKA